MSSSRSRRNPFPLQKSARRQKAPQALAGDPRQHGICLAFSPVRSSKTETAAAQKAQISRFGTLVNLSDSGTNDSHERAKWPCFTLAIGLYTAQYKQLISDVTPEFDLRCIYARLVSVDIVRPEIKHKKKMRRIGYIAAAVVLIPLVTYALSRLGHAGAQNHSADPRRDRWAGADALPSSRDPRQSEHLDF